MCDSTRRPLSIRCWIASVISSSPRALGSIARAASWTHGREHVDADERQVCCGSRRLLDQPHDALAARARRRRSARGRAPGSAGSARRRPRSRKRSTRSTMPPCSRLSPRYMTNGSRRGTAPRSAPRAPGRRARPARCRSPCTPNCEPSPAAARISSPVSGAMMIPTSSIPAAGDRLDAVEQHGLVGDRHELLGAGVGDRPQARPLPPDRISPFMSIAAAYRAARRPRQLAVIPARPLGTNGAPTRLGAWARPSRDLGLAGAVAIAGYSSSAERATAAGRAR